MELVKAFTSNSLNANILIKGTMKDPLFKANDIGNILEITNIKQNLKDLEDDEKTTIDIPTPGGIQSVNFLTETGLYKILFKSRKPIAQKFQKWVCEVIKEIRLNGQYKLENELQIKNDKLNKLENEKKNLEVTNKNISVLEKQKLLLEQFNREEAIVYIIKVKTLENGEYIVKIGESGGGITSRYNAHKTNYDECILLDCFSVNKSRNFEKFIHGHPMIRPSKYKILPRHEKENELFLIGKELTYNILLNVIKENIHNYNYSQSESNELYNENKKLKQKIENLDDEIKFLKGKFNSLCQENPELLKNIIQENIINNNSSDITHKLDLLLKKMELIEEKMNSSPSSNKESLAQPQQTYQPRLTTGFNQQLPTLGPRLQKINPETLQLIKVYESVTEAMNENINIKRPSIMKAISENTIYCGFRWLLVERNLDPNVIHNIEPTVQIQQQNIGYIAKLNSEKSTILNVYLDRKTAAKLNGYKSISALDNPVKNGTVTNGYYYILYEKCEPELIADFEEKLGGQPLLYKNGLGQFDASNNMVNEFSCKYECLRTLKMSDKTLTKALENKTPYNGFTYKELGSKLSVYP